VGLKSVLAAQSDVELLPDHADAAFAEVVVADYETGVELCAAVRSAARSGGPQPRILVFTHRDTEVEIRHALDTGVRGYLTADCAPEELLDGVRALHLGMRHLGGVAAGRLADSVVSEWLTSRETEVLRLVVQGLGNKGVARRLDISVGTVKTHLKAIFVKLNARTRTEVAAVARRRGLLAIPSAAHVEPALEGMRRWS